MNHFEKIAVQLESYGLDAILLTGEANRFYATGFHSMGTDGAALITRKKNYYFTDARYTEAAFKTRSCGRPAMGTAMPTCWRKWCPAITSDAWGLRTPA